MYSFERSPTMQHSGCLRVCPSIECDEVGINATLQGCRLGPLISRLLIASLQARQVMQTHPESSALGSGVGHVRSPWEGVVCALVIAAISN